MWLWHSDRLWGSRSLSNGYRSSLPEGKAAGSWSWTHPHQEPRLRMRSATPPFYKRPHCVMLHSRAEKFTFCFKYECPGEVHNYSSAVPTSIITSPYETWGFMETTRENLYKSGIVEVLYKICRSMPWPDPLSCPKRPNRNHSEYALNRAASTTFRN
jgi:hypothetical protein